MRNRLIGLWDQIQASYWFIPTVMAFLAILLSSLSIKLDEWLIINTSQVSVLNYIDSPEGARAVLSTIASSMITIAGVVFSLNMVVLSLTSQQYGSFVISNFMRDHTNQFILGVFTATFIYCLLILRTVHGVGDSIFVPHVSILIGLGLALASIAVLIYFIHHVAYSIQASTIIERLGQALMAGIDDIFPIHVGESNKQQDASQIEAELPDDWEERALAITSDNHGYLQVLDEGEFLNIATEHNLLIKLLVRPGDFISAGDRLVLLWPPPSKATAEAIPAPLNRLFTLGSKRTSTQDVEMLFDGLNQVAIRALSPGINDPFTAIMCIDRLSEALVKLAVQHRPSPYRFDDQEKLRVIASTITFPAMLSASFDHIYQYGKTDMKIVGHLLKTLGHMGQQIPKDDPENRERLSQYTSMLFRGIKPGSEIEADQLEAYYRSAAKVLDIDPSFEPNPMQHQLR